MKQITVKVDDQVYDQFQELYNSLLTAGEVTTKADFIMWLLTPKEDNQANEQTEEAHRQLRDKHSKMAAEFTEYKQAAELQMERNIETIKSMGERSSKLVEEHEKLQQMYDSLNAIASEPQTVERELKANELLLTLPDWSVALLNETCVRLSAKFNQEVTPAMVLMDMFNRYTIEQLNEWFYPFMIRPNEFEAICGYNYQTLKSYVRKK